MVQVGTRTLERLLRIVIVSIRIAACGVVVGKRWQLEGVEDVAGARVGELFEHGAHDLTQSGGGMVHGGNTVLQGSDGGSGSIVLFLLPRLLLY